jgi:hypothetical protein
MESVVEYQGIDTDQGIEGYFARHWGDWFPQLKSLSTFV